MIKQEKRNTWIETKVKNLCALLLVSKFDANFFISKRGVPCLSVMLGPYRYGVCYFATPKYWKVFDAEQVRTVCEDESAVIEHLKTVRGTV